MEIFTPNSDIHTKNTRNKFNLFLPQTRLTKYQKGVYFAGTKIFNYLPENIKKVSDTLVAGRATLSINNYKTEKEVQKGCPQGSCCGPSFWNIMYNSLLNLEFNSRTKVIAFADDLIILTRGAGKIEVENYTNQSLKQIERWANKNKI